MRNIRKPVIFETGTLLLFLGLASLGLSIDRFFRVHLTVGWLLDYAASILLIVGVPLRLWASKAIFSSGRGTPLYIRPTQALVNAGPYKYVRNPLYIGGYLSYLGVFLLIPSIFLLVLGVAGLPATYAAATREERGLEKRFGQEYRDYKHRVPGWFPRIRPKKIE